MARRRKESKKPFAASSTARLRSRAVFYLDESIYSHRLIAALKEAGVSVHLPGLDVPLGTPDAVWLEQAGRLGWIVLLRDQKVRYRQSETVAIVTAKVAAFVFTGGQVKAVETAEVLVRRLDKMINIATSERRPFVYTITAGGRLVRLKLKRASRK